MWREKYIKTSWLLFALNALISVMQAGFAYGHYVKHEYWQIAMCLFFVGLNGYVAYTQVRNVMRMKQELKEFVWSTLQSPSENFR